MRVENKKQAAADLSYQTSSNNSRPALVGLHVNHHKDARLSTSCPSLNNSLSTIGMASYAIPIGENNNYNHPEGQGFDMNLNYNNSQSPLGTTPGHSSRRRKNNDPSNPTSQQGGGLAVPNSKGHRKRQGQHRQRR